MKGCYNFSIHSEIYLYLPTKYKNMTKINKNEIF